MSCGVLIVRGNPIQQILLMEHADRLDLPKGHVDAGETEMECALRELEEETGIGVADIEIDPHFRFEHRYKVFPKRFHGQECDKTLVIFLGYLQRDVKICLTEHRGFRWEPWNPPHELQAQTIDPLLAAVAQFVSSSKASR